MKKIILLILTLSLALGVFASCSKKNDSTEPKGDGTVESTAKIISESLPTRVVTLVSYTSGNDVFESSYKNEIDRAGGKSEFTFTFQRLAIPGEDQSDSHIKTESGKVQFKDGQVLRAEGANWEELGEGYLELALTVTESLLKTFEYSEDGCDLTATIAPENSKRVFGTAISAEGDITLKIDTNGTYLYGAEISYVAKGTGSEVVIKTSYEYAPITFDF